MISMISMIYACFKNFNTMSPLYMYMVRSRKLMELLDNVAVNVIFGWKLLSVCVNFVRSNSFGHIRKMSSIYLVSYNGCSSIVYKNLLKKTDINMLAMVGEKAAPIAVPVVW